MPSGSRRTGLWLGIVCLVLGQWTLSLLDTAGKTLALAGYHVVMIAWMRYTTNTAFMAVTLVLCIGIAPARASCNPLTCICKSCARY